MPVLVAALSCCGVERSVAAEPNAIRGTNTHVGVYLDTSIENASPLWYEPGPDGELRVHLLYDHERHSPNRAAGHLHFRLEGQAGAKVVLEFDHLDNVWNGQPGSVAGEMGALVISTNGRDWTSVPTENIDGHRIRLSLVLPANAIEVARLEPYRLSDLDRLLAELGRHSRVHLETIGATVQGRPLEIVRVGNPRAPFRVFVRARAHPWESGSNWVLEGLLRRLVQDDADARRFRQRFCVYALPMANKDGVAQGRTRFNLQGMDLNRNWDRPADPQLAPENFALERWLERMIRKGQRPHFALELHNDGRGLLHVSRPPVPNLAEHVARMAHFETLLRRHTWFTEGSTPGDFRNTGTLADAWLERYGVDAIIHEFSGQWIAGLKERPLAKHWLDYGARLAEVLDEYFATPTSTK